MTSPLPAGWRLRLAAGTRVVGGGLRGGSGRGSILVGGSPLRVLTLSDRGDRLFLDWLTGQPVGEAEEERVLARRLLDAGLADPDPPARAGRTEPAWAGDAEPASLGDAGPEVTIVVQVYEDADRLRSCLAPLAAAGAPIIVVDDGSPDPRPIAEVAEQFGAEYVR